MKAEEMIGLKFNRWTVLGIGPITKDKRGKNVYRLHCRCDCGTERDVLKYTLLSGASKSCGCLLQEKHHEQRKKSIMEMVGKRYGRGVIQRFVGTRNRARLWELKCDCGNTYICDTAHLNNGHIVSCGCYQRDDHTTHGGVANKERLFGIWMGMRRRCNDPHNAAYHHYGGRGIMVCDEWENDYAAFREWALNNGYDKTLTIDRIDVNGNYCPENCRWVTKTQQCRNTRYNRYEEIDGVVKPVIQWLDDYNVINRGAVYKRLGDGWTMKDALFKPLTRGKTPILPQDSQTHD